MIRIAICDDNSENIQELSELLIIFAERMKTEINIRKYNSGKNLLFVWEDQEQYPDILYLDIGMPSIDGMKVARQIREKGYQNEIIFFTRSEGEIRNAFDVNAFHYIVKEDTSVEKMEEIFCRAVNQSMERQKEYISFSSAGENRNIAVRDIQYFQTEGRVVTIYYEQDKTFEFYTALGKLDGALCKKGFVRMNRATLVNTDYIQSYDANEIMLKSGEVIPIGRHYRKVVKEELAYWCREVGI